MDTRMAGALAASLLVLMVMAPRGMAHDSASNSDKPTGNYVGAAGVWRVISPLGSNDDDPLLGEGGLFAGQIACDLEVLSDGDEGTPDDNGLDEPYVDGDVTQGSFLSEGTWDDGGYGGACHTPYTYYVNNGQYGFPEFNTQKCDYEDAKAWDANVPDVWISAQCDWLTKVPAGIDDVDRMTKLGFRAAYCANDAGTTRSTWELQRTCPDDFLECSTGINVLDPADTLCFAGPGGQSCGPDGVIDAVNEGLGWAGVSFPTVPTDCPEDSGVASVFLWDSIDVSAAGEPVVQSPTFGYIR